MSSNSRFRPDKPNRVRVDDSAPEPVPGALAPAAPNVRASGHSVDFRRSVFVAGALHGVHNCTKKSPTVLFHFREWRR